MLDVLSWFMNKEQFLGMVRHIVTFIGGLIVAKGGLDPTVMDTILGVIITLAGVVWSTLSPEKTLTAEKIVEKMEPAKMQAIEKIIAKPEPAKAPLPPM